jgi:hypothetical protein
MTVSFFSPWWAQKSSIFPVGSTTTDRDLTVTVSSSGAPSSSISWNLLLSKACCRSQTKKNSGNTAIFLLVKHGSNIPQM